MKRTAIATIVLAASATFSTFTWAQLRHDDRPHGMPKNRPMATESKEAPQPVGRHDERPHGQKKVTKKSAESAAREKSPDEKSPAAK